MTEKGNVVVLGGTGFVGEHVCEAFARQGHEVVAVARSAPERGRFLSLDLTTVSAGELATRLSETAPAIVVNAIGSIWGGSAEDMVERCLTPTRRLLDALALMPGLPRLVHLGSVLEHTPARPPGSTGPVPAQYAYGRAKAEATRLVLEATAAGGVDGTVLRVANVAGPGSPEVSLLGRVARELAASAAADRGAVVKLSLLKAYRDYVDVRDVAEAVVATAAAPVSGEAFDIGRGHAVPVRLLVNLLIEASGVRTRLIEQADRPAARAWHDWIEVDTGPAQRRLGWRPRRSLRESVDDFWEHTSGRPRAALAPVH
ncbi:Nucleoside-diphosphate-sugar epimerase [Amycolatopsis lurida]|uniref:NAD-dependent epimerase/dehydratase family protein n=1 Tax=Amycolatopsis lurida TaxID=31959 RepID=UPI0005515131|nr:NAD(P)-dependent oxidoreductase [Amycolatopsis lurida]SED90496.1 Nucleoside-diphosphate-sugar epimerase [Amycolatopsis lurida]